LAFTRSSTIIFNDRSNAVSQVSGITKIPENLIRILFQNIPLSCLQDIHFFSLFFAKRQDGTDLIISGSPTSINIILKYLSS